MRNIMLLNHLRQSLVSCVTEDESEAQARPVRVRWSSLMTAFTRRGRNGGCQAPAFHRGLQRVLHSVDATRM